MQRVYSKSLCKEPIPLFDCMKLCKVDHYSINCSTTIDSLYNLPWKFLFLKRTLSASTQGSLWSFLKYLSYSWLISWLINTFYTSKYLFSFRCSCLETCRWIGSVHSSRLGFGLGCSLGFSQEEKLVSSILDVDLSFVISDTITYLLVTNLYLAIFFVWMQTTYIYLNCHATRLYALPKLRLASWACPAEFLTCLAKRWLTNRRRQRNSHRTQTANVCWKLAFTFKISDHSLHALLA